MAVVYSGMCCALCREPISDEELDTDNFFATTHFIGDVHHPLWRFSDAAMHNRCFMDWKHRLEFIQLYNSVKIGRDDGVYFQLTGDGETVYYRDGKRLTSEEEAACEAEVNRRVAEILADIMAEEPKSRKRGKSKLDFGQFFSPKSLI